MKMKFKLQKFMPYVMSACLLTFVAACGSDNDDDDSSPAPQQQEEQQSDEGIYRVTFQPLNGQVSDSMAGTAEISIEGEDVRAMVNITGAPNSTHPQHIHTGRACPTVGNDTNGDGFIDAVEADAVSGQALIPLDGNISAQDLGSNDYPSGPSYNYNRSAIFSLMLADLRAPDINTDDHVVKLDTDEELNLAGRVIIIHGVPNSTELPETVQAHGDNGSPHRSLPIACGVIERVQGEETAGGANGGTTGGTDGQTNGGTTGGTDGQTNGGTTGGTTGDI